VSRLALGAAAALALVAAAGCGGLKGQDTATARCDATAAEFEFDPSGHIRVRVDGHVVAEADSGSRGIDFDACPRARTQRGWATGTRYTRTITPTQLRCRFAGDIFIHVHPTATSDSGDISNGSAVYLVIGPNRLIISSASVTDGRSGSLAFSRHFCTPFGTV
jgi:hypothetical protein